MEWVEYNARKKANTYSLGAIESDMSVVAACGTAARGAGSSCARAAIEAGGSSAAGLRPNNVNQIHLYA
ncbi:hypothetical protein RR48_07513 [Papilio machaon]|uniref:Uncharacterized protein n=1 Tax=Papilio machaon TaxID=76193 RepID=A0A194RQA3_PAPMA|nr:hypothetical protein RR48_07513 [Papilio machaon]